MNENRKTEQALIKIANELKNIRKLLTIIASHEAHMMLSSDLFIEKDEEDPAKVTLYRNNGDGTSTENRYYWND